MPSLFKPLNTDWTPAAALCSLVILIILNPVFLNAFVPSVYDKDLEEVIKDETSGDFTTALLALLQGDKSDSTKVDMDMAQTDAEVEPTFKRCFTFFQQIQRND